MPWPDVALAGGRLPLRLQPKVFAVKLTGQLNDWPKPCRTLELLRYDVKGCVGKRPPTIRHRSADASATTVKSTARRAPNPAPPAPFSL